jgi:hypothetical protein
VINLIDRAKLGDALIDAFELVGVVFALLFHHFHRRIPFFLSLGQLLLLAPWITLTSRSCPNTIQLPVPTQGFRNRMHLNLLVVQACLLSLLEGMNSLVFRSHHLRV